MREREKSPCGDRSTAHTAVTYVVHFVFKQCAETRGNEETFTADTDDSRLSFVFFLLSSLKSNEQ